MSEYVSGFHATELRTLRFNSTCRLPIINLPVLISHHNQQTAKVLKIIFQLT